MNDIDRETETRHHARWIPAAMVMAVGVLFLIVNLGYHLPFLDAANWWAWLILFAAVWPLSEAWSIYRRSGRFDAQVGQALLPALSIVLVAVFFIANLSWATWWPLFVILGGLYMLAGQGRRSGRVRGG